MQLSQDGKVINGPQEVHGYLGDWVTVWLGVLQIAVKFHDQMLYNCT